MMNVAINGLGRIGRATLKILVDSSDMRVKAVNDLVPAEEPAHPVSVPAMRKYGHFSDQRFFPST